MMGSLRHQRAVEPALVVACPLNIFPEGFPDYRRGRGVLNIVLAILEGRHG